MIPVIEQIKNGQTVLGLELGSTRIKAVLIGKDHMPLAEGSYTWESHLEHGFWSYSIDEVWKGVQDAYGSCMKEASEKYGCFPDRLASIGISAMMHGYLAFDQKEQLLIPFRTWRNTTTGPAAAALSELFQYNIPQRWSVAHLYQAILNQEEHVSQISFIMTLAAYVHYKLTGEKVIGIGDASGMFPIDIKTGDYDQTMLDSFGKLDTVKDFPWNLKDILPKVLKAGEQAGILTEEGAKLLDATGTLKPGIPICPPEGDAQTGMVATNAVKIRTGNVSAGTSDFAILVLERELSRMYSEIDLITSPTGALAANVHCNNCTSDLNAWIGMFREFASDLNMNIDDNTLYSYLFRKALTADKNAGGLLNYNYYSGEGITHLDDGRPLFVRKPDARLSLSNFMLAHLYSSLATLKIGMDIITRQEKMSFDEIIAHGGLFKTPEVGQKILAAAFHAPITVMETAEKGGAWGIALLAQYLTDGQGQTLETWLDKEVFAGTIGTTMTPDPEDMAGFEEFLENYQKGLRIEREACTL